MVSASTGGGGRGMRIVRSSSQMQTDFQSAMNESIKAFGDDKIFIEKYLNRPKTSMPDPGRLIRKHRASL